MSQRKLVSGLPLAAGSVLVSIAVFNIAFSEGIFMLEWMGSFLAFYGLSYLLGSKMAMTLSGAVLVVGSLGDIALIGGLNPLNWIIVNYMVFIHAALGSLAGDAVRERSASAREK
ncbi:MAG: hypothetical protein NWE89_05195 [Candidatus Bathyarchaeota archaeon]|nr:hypothetical protein [Candidatus Bathyarchaeota archaeon]